MEPNRSRIPYSTYGHPSSYYTQAPPLPNTYATYQQRPLHTQSLAEWQVQSIPSPVYEQPPTIPSQMWPPMPIYQSAIPPPIVTTLHSPLSGMTVTALPLTQSYGDVPVSLASPISQISQAESDRSYGLLSTSSVSTTGAPSPTGSPRDAQHPSGFPHPGHLGMHPSMRSTSPGTAELSMYGFMNAEGSWSCAFPGCTSRATFTRGCDLRKHHRRHTKSFFCRFPGCSQSQGGGFSSKKDLARHEAKHNPGVVCEWPGCDRLFSRVDNMVC
jgi:hypothetical protein